MAELTIKNRQGKFTLTAWRRLNDSTIEEVSFWNDRAYGPSLTTAKQCRKVADALSLIADEWQGAPHAKGPTQASSRFWNGIKRQNCRFYC